MLFFTFLGTRPLAVPDEGRYAEIPREMNATGNWGVPHLNGVPYLEKPPLMYWLNALAQKWGGRSFFFCRLVNALFGVGTGILLYLFGRRLGAGVGEWSALIFSTSLLGFGMSQMLTLDMGLTFFTTATLFLLLEAALSEEAAPRRRYFMGAGLAAAGAVMTKGLVGFIFPLLIWVPWLILSGRLGRLKDKWWWRGLGLTLCLLIPWHMWILHRYPGFAKFYFWHEHFERYLTPAHHRSKFLFFIPLSFLMGFFPWILFLPRAWYRFSITHSPARERLRYATVWMGGVVLFFTFSNSQLIPYVLPAIPPAALWVGWALSQRGPTLFKPELQLAGLLYMMAAFLAPLVM
ncbi:MAG: phospholipid carrier-dependent glycosyltransferase, partial [Puniceicoccales bacterium]|nr:phospholipid carrier-dependent glycosyltransferase [Puniceicoccales bacterium]